MKLRVFIDNFNATSLAIIVHVALLGILVLSLDWSNPGAPPSSKVEPVQAMIVDESEVAEEIEQIAASLDNDKTEALIDATTRIFEACGFQDITGQRVSKVVRALQRIEVKITDLLKTFGEDPGTPVAKKKAAPIKIDPTGPDADLLIGPQMPKQTNTQAEIDAILASFD